MNNVYNPMKMENTKALRENEIEMRGGRSGEREGVCVWGGGSNYERKVIITILDLIPYYM